MSRHIEQLHSISEECQGLIHKYPWKFYRYHTDISENEIMASALSKLADVQNSPNTRVFGFYEDDSLQGIAIIKHQADESKVLGLPKASLDSLHYNSTAQNIENKLSLFVEELLCELSPYQLVTALIPGEDIVAVQALEQNGFRLMATNVTYTIQFKGKNPRECEYAQGKQRDPSIRQYRREEIPTIVSIARDSYSTYQGHLHRNPHIGKERATEYYVKEIQRACEKDAATVLVATIDNNIVGFSTCHWLDEINDHSDARIGEIIYSGIATGEARRRSFYTEKILQCLEWFQKEGATSVEVNANITNVAVIRAWQKPGFYFAATRYRLHRNAIWVANDE